MAKNDTELRADVWQKFVAGNTSFFKEVFTEYYGEMYGYGIKLNNQPELVKDCIQELFKTIWERRDNLTHIDSPNVYLFVSLRRKILKKSNFTKKTTGSLDDIDEESFIQFGEDEIIIKNEMKYQQKEQLSQALNQLSDRQREIIYLHFYNGMSYSEIEKILSINRQSVRNHIYRAMKSLRSFLDTEVMRLVMSLLILFFHFLSYSN